MIYLNTKKKLKISIGFILYICVSLKLVFNFLEINKSQKMKINKNIKCFSFYNIKHVRLKYE
jgi:hypothetical protein